MLAGMLSMLAGADSAVQTKHMGVLAAMLQTGEANLSTNPKTALLVRMCMFQCWLISVHIIKQAVLIVLVWYACVTH